MSCKLEVVVLFFEIIANLLLSRPLEKIQKVLLGRIGEEAHEKSKRFR